LSSCESAVPNALLLLGTIIEFVATQFHAETEALAASRPSKLNKPR
jgi:hypothetical protein